MRRERATLIARSDISGWGLFNKYPLKAGDFIGEYVGEAITQEEAERRGVLYDVKNQNYLFLAASDLVIDAMRKGNKMRFIVSTFFISSNECTVSHRTFVIQESFGRPECECPK
jgi:SET domain-containing protein